ncbi:MAG: hypothetical protein NTX42_05515 [Methanothrix sp.]|nr:hypothetical protein [Methanothrix sp.]
MPWWHKAWILARWDLVLVLTWWHATLAWWDESLILTVPDATTVP